MRKVCKYILVIDDLANRQHAADIILDVSYRRAQSDYQKLNQLNGKILTGSQYALLRDEFSNYHELAKKRRDNIKKINNVLICFGGTDPKGLTLRAIEALLKCNKGYQFDIVITSNNKNIDQITHFSHNYEQISLYIDHNNIAELMYQADIAIGAAGGMTWERACLGLPTLTVQIADNQQYIINTLANDNIIHTIDHLKIENDLFNFFNKSPADILSISNNLAKFIKAV